MQSHGMSCHVLTCKHSSCLWFEAPRCSCWVTVMRLTWFLCSWALTSSVFLVTSRRGCDILTEDECAGVTIPATGTASLNLTDVRFTGVIYSTECPDTREGLLSGLYLKPRSSVYVIYRDYCDKHDDVIEWKHFFALLALCAGNSPVTGEFPAQRPVTRSFDVFCDLRLNKRLSKQSWGWWFEMLSWSLWRHYNENLQISTGAQTTPGLTRPFKLRIHGSQLTYHISKFRMYISNVIFHFVYKSAVFNWS